MPKCGLMFKIEKSVGANTTVYRLVGRIGAEHLDELRMLMADATPGIRLDLAEVTLVDLDVIRFLGSLELKGVQVANCSRYITEWLQRERSGKD